ncbi:MAG: LacI family DNA-binding transcriptional regulator [Butyricicoccus sp.]
MAVTLKQIAELAGVHKSTVDKVIHNRPGVSDEVRQKIRRILDEQGYESNPLAKALNYQKKKMTVAVVLPRVDALAELRKGIEMVRRDCASFNVEIQYYEFDYPDAAAQAACLIALSKSGVSGVVVCPIEDEGVRQAIDALAALHIPVVTLNSDMDDSARLCFVGRNETQAGRVAARLISMLLGRAGTIGILTSKIRAVRQRENGFQSYLREQYPGIRVAQVEDMRENAEQAYERTCAMLRSQPLLDGLFVAGGCVTDICRAVRDCGLRGRLVIVCFERYPEIVELVRTGEIACTISGDLSGQGQRAMRLLFECLIYDKRPEEQKIYLSNDILLAENI